MHKLHRALTLAALLAATPAFAAEDEPTQDEETLIATVNDQDYKLDVFRAFYNERLAQTGAQNSADFQEVAFNEFLNLLVSAQEGEKRDLGDDREVRAAMELQRLMILSSAALQSIAAEIDLSDEDMDEAYEQFTEQMKRQEYKARHILVDEQEKAEELIAKLDQADGAGFIELAKEHSLGPTADQGGDLGWFDARQMVKPFSDAVAKLEKGSYTEQPVKTQFGWHVILLEDIRDAEPPSLDDARPTLEAALRRQKVGEALAQMRKDAVITLNTDVVKLKEGGDDDAED